MKCTFLGFRIFRFYKVDKYIVMSKNNEKVYYAVGQGREIGIYHSWKDCKVQVDGLPNAKYRKFYSLEEAQEFISFWKNYSTPVTDQYEKLNVSTKETEGIDFQDTDTKHLNGTHNDIHTDSSKSVEVKEEPAEEHVSQFSISPTKSVVECSHCHSSSFVNDKVVVRNMDILSLNLRLDSIEKRFDTCLKEIGGISSQMSNIRVELNGLKDMLIRGLGTRYECSPTKSRGGMMQTVLNFGTDSTQTFSKRKGSSYSPSSSSESLKVNEINNYSKEMDEKKRKRPLKRRLSQTSGNNLKKESDSDETDEPSAVQSKKSLMDLSSFTVDKDNYVEVYTDGACTFNGAAEKKGRAGIGVWFGDNHPFNVGRPVDGPPTNNVAEIQAARTAIDLAISAGISKLKIYTDSEFLINSITKWIHRWKRNGWKLINGGEVKNREELEKLDKAASKISVRWEKVAGHTGIKGNEMADRLANEGAAQYISKK